MPTVPHTVQKSHNKSTVPPTRQVVPINQQCHHHVNSAIIMPTVSSSCQQCHQQVSSARANQAWAPGSTAVGRP
ncbi:hypothetical protein Pmani_013691 [Petrolisthes manimaculis]|uniref:Uncharacterized protein n=1 Tax=Petrolisthes manimaculis TaxID=1843537 RepID=A0AAE1PUD7_9EUCA|nr:hypothetical protein Pmani_013691 [Petrolisthes manimaculis]